MPDATRPGRPRRRLAALVTVAVAALAPLAAGCGGDDDGGEGEQAPTTLTETTLTPEQRAEADVLECLGPLGTDPSATVRSAEECTPDAGAEGASPTTTATIASAPGA
jgi:hypothetical protein